MGDGEREHLSGFVIWVPGERAAGATTRDLRKDRRCWIE